MTDILLSEFLSTAADRTPTQELQSEDHSSNPRSVPAELLCPQCLQLYEMPLFLPCSHTFCRNCTEALISSSDNVLQQRNRFICPTCRNIIKYGPEGVDCLPRNVNLEQAVTRFKLESQSKHSECTRHHQFNMQLIMWCEECNKKICPLCALEDTHKDHKIAPVAVFRRYKEVRNRLEKASDTLTNKVETIGKNILQVRDVLKKIESKADHLKSRVDAECDEMAKQVEIRRKTMYQDIDVATKKKQRKQKDEMKLLKAKYNETKDAIEKISSVLQTGGATEFLKVLAKSGLSNQVNEL